jgi:malonyl-CoA O-methyltransferase
MHWTLLDLNSKGLGTLCSTERAFKKESSRSLSFQGLVSNGEALPFAQPHFDLIVSGATFQWYQHWKLSLKASLSCLKPGGVLAFTQFIQPSMAVLRESAAAIEKDSAFLPLMEHEQIVSALGEIAPDVSLDYFETRSATQYFNTLHDLRQNLKNLGVGGSGRPNRPWSKSDIQRWTQGVEAQRSEQGLPLNFTAGCYLLKTSL